MFKFCRITHSSNFTPTIFMPSRMYLHVSNAISINNYSSSSPTYNNTNTIPWHRHNILYRVSFLSLFL